MTAHPSIPDTIPDNLDEYADEPLGRNTCTGSELIHIAPADVGTLRIVTTTGDVLWQLDNRGDPVNQDDIKLGMTLLETERRWSPRCVMPPGAGTGQGPTPGHDSQASAPPEPEVYETPMGGILLAMAVGGVLWIAVALLFWWLT